MAQPAYEVRYGYIKATIWRNHTKAGDRFSVALARLYRDGDVWRESGRFGRDDLPLVAKAADQAHTWIFSQHRSSPDHDSQSA